MSRGMPKNHESCTKIAKLNTKGNIMELLWNYLRRIDSFDFATIIWYHIA